MSKRFALLAALLAVALLLTACGPDSTGAARDYMEAVLKGDVEAAQEVACDPFKEGTATLAAISAGLAEESRAIRNIDLKYDIGKGRNLREVVVTGSYDIVRLTAAGAVIVDSADTYEVAAVVRDVFDVDGDGDHDEQLNARIVLTMERVGDEWCVAGLSGGYFFPEEMRPAWE
jgi:predicted small secreted protein